ncbi:MFS transporter [Photobacterium sp. 53610]|uniref:MFS transporter n=1 Tax=Photobacterium sp. 53610 TaxID=3102789 RepID=UPI002ED8EFD3
MSPKELTIRFGIQQSLHWTIAGIMIPVIALLFQSRGLSLFDIGFVMAVWIGSTAILEIPLGGIADTYGRRKTYLFSLLMNILGGIVLFIADSLPLILFAAALLGASNAVYSGTLDAWFYDSSRHTQGNQSFHSALAIINVFVTIGLATGSLIGGWLPDSSASSFFNSTRIYDLNIVIVALSNLVLILMTLVLIPSEIHLKTSQVETSQAKTTQTKKNNADFLQASLQAIKTSIRHHVLNRLMQTTLVFGMVLSCIENFWQPYLAELIQGTAYGVTVFGILSALYFLMSAGASLLSIRLLRYLKGSHKFLMFTTRASAGLALIALANTTHLFSFALCYLLFFFLFTAGNNSESVMLHENTEEHVRSTMLSIRSCMVTSGGVIASLFFGFLSEYYGISVSWTICGVMLVVSSALFILIPEKSEPQTA